jgi:hypothetical protein
MRWMWRGVAAGVLLLGWLFILWQNKFHITVPVVIIGLGYLAVVAMVTNLWRVGASAVAPEDNSPDAWSRPIGPRGELEKEKKTLLKAIKEAEFDQLMGKLSKTEADEMIRTYRGRAIEVIKEIDRLDAGHADGPREAIKREVQARIALEQSRSKKDKRTKGGAKAQPAKQAGKAADAKPVAAKPEPVVETKPVDTSPVETDAVKTDAVETDPVHTPADDASPEDRAAEAATKSTEATS